MIEPIQPDGKTLAKATLLRGWNDVLRKYGLLPAIEARLTPEVVALLRDPPASTQWVDAAYYECVAQAVLEEVGEARLDELFVEAQRTGWVILLSRWLGSIVRVFGASPAAVLSRAEGAAKANTVGFALKWVDHGERSGELVVTYPYRPRIHPAAAWGTSSACQLAADAVGATMRRERPVIEATAEGGVRVRVRVHW